MKKNLTYSDKLKDPRWQKKRLEILERDGWMCRNCGDNESTLHVHHKVYTGKEPWEIPSEWLITLCEGCHEFETQRMSDLIHDLGVEVKKKFLSGGVIDLIFAFEQLEPYHSGEVFSSAINYWFRTPELVKEMYDRYFEYLDQKHKEESGGKDLPF